MDERRQAHRHQRAQFPLASFELNIVAGLLGMNVGGVPLTDHPYGFWVIFVVVIGFTVVAGCIVIRRLRSG